MIEPLQDLAKQRTHLHSRQVLAQTHMGTETKRDLLALFAVDAKRIGVGIDRLVAVRRRVPEYHRLTGLDLLTAHLGISRGRAHKVTYRRYPANHFINGSGHQSLRICPKRIHLFWIVDKPEQAACRGCTGCVMPSSRNDHVVTVSLVFGNLRPIDLSVGDDCCQIVLGIGAPRLAKFDEIVFKIFHHI